MTLRNYADILASIKSKVYQARQQAILAVNAHMLAVYHEIGTILLKQQKEEGWGTKVIERLAKDLRSEFPDTRGFSVRNIAYMKAFAEAWPEAVFMQQPVAELQINDLQQNIIMQQLVAQIPWGHHTVLLDKVQTRQEREFYLQSTVRNKWSRTILLRQIETGLYHRKGMAITNFKQTLPDDISDLARETFNNPYILEFAGLSEKFQEKELEKALIKHVEKFILELGKGFTYAGSQYHISIDGNDYYPDLLFFNYLLNCFIIFEIKVGEFIPEFTGKLNFYVNAINKQVKQSQHKPTIGVLLCKTPSKTIIEYALTDLKNPIGVADYEFVKSLPKELKSGIPTVEELEKEINKEYEEFRISSDQRLESLKKEIANLKVERIRTEPTFQVLCELFDKGFYFLYGSLIKRLSSFNELFMNHGYTWLELPTVRNLEELGRAWKNDEYLKNRHSHTFQYILEGLRSGGPQPINLVSGVTLHMDSYSYNIVVLNYNNNRPFIYKYYHQPPEPAEIESICSIAFDIILTELEVNTKEIKQQYHIQ
jgi:predicted nuclease of restriction endonuclease-like (RecB) superfamily